MLGGTGRGRTTDAALSDVRELLASTHDLLAELNGVRRQFLNKVVGPVAKELPVEVLTLINGFDISPSVEALLELKERAVLEDAPELKKPPSSPPSGVRTTAEDWRELRVPELKAELRERDLPVSGTKPELIQRLMVAAADTEDTGVDGTLVSVAMLKQLKQVEHAHKPVRCEREVARMVFSGVAHVTRAYHMHTGGTSRTL